MKDSRTKILDTAEKLFATKGLQSVSVREINATAGVGNGLLQYHFRDANGVISALLDRRIVGLLADRQAMIEGLRERDTPPSKRDIVEINVLPLARLAIEGGSAEKCFIKVLAQLYQSRDKQHQRFAVEYINRLDAQLGEWLYILRPTAELDALTEVKYWIASNAIMTTLSELDSPRYWTASAHAPDAPARSLWKIVEVLIDFVAKSVE
jgi:AcrR family transcriptional regulator